MQDRTPRAGLRCALAVIITALLAAAVWSGHVASAQQLNWTGRIVSLPASGLVGQWNVAGRTFVTTAATDFRQDKGAFAVGVCVEVEYVGAAEPYSATKIASKSSDDCTVSTPTPSVTPGVTPSITPSATPTTEVERYARIESFPTGLIGAWVIGGVTYNATAQSEFKQENGAFGVGVCVKVHASTTTTPATLREVESERDYRCSGTTGTGGAAGEGEIYGLLQSFPANLIGEWKVAGMTYVADAATEFKQANGPFAVGSTVKVHFATDAAGVNRAREIETKFANDSGGSDDDGNGSYEGAEGHAYGIADSVPAGLVGAWSIGGIAYTATAGTKFEQNDGALVNGARVKVEYYLGSGGERIATQIESTTETGDATAPGNFKVFGFVNHMPSGGLVGNWVVDNVTYVAGAGAKFNETNAVLGVGAYVAVEYSVQNGVKQVHEIEAHVPPGAGPQTALGTIDDKGGSGVRAAAAVAIDASGAATTWVIGGVRYSVIAATDFNDVLGGLNVGDQAIVNSYTAADGALVATQVRGITLTANLYLPAVRR